MMLRPSRLFATVVLCAGTALAACSDSTSGPNGGQWYEGTWLAVRGNNAPLPYRDRFGGSVRTIVLTLNADSTKASSFVSNGTTVYNFRENESPVNRALKLTPGTDTVFLYDGPKADIGQLALTVRRRADTLELSTFQGGVFKLVRSR